MYSSYDRDANIEIFLINDRKISDDPQHILKNYIQVLHEFAMLLDQYLFSPLFLYPELLNEDQNQYVDSNFS
jgi:hypothetical protein